MQVSFGVAPAVLAFTLGQRTAVDVFILTFFVCSGIARLARFNVTAHLVPKDTAGKSKYFQGLPIPSSLMLVALMWYWIEYNYYQSGVPLGTFQVGQQPVHVFSVVWAVWSACMVSRNLKIPKL